MRGAVPKRKSLISRLCNYLSFCYNPTLNVNTVAPIINDVTQTWHSVKTDTGASKHFISGKDKHLTTNTQSIKNGRSFKKEKATTHWSLLF